MTLYQSTMKTVVTLKPLQRFKKTDVLRISEDFWQSIKNITYPLYLKPSLISDDMILMPLSMFRGSYKLRTAFKDGVTIYVDPKLDLDYLIYQHSQYGTYGTKDYSGKAYVELVVND